MFVVVTNPNDPPRLVSVVVLESAGELFETVRRALADSPRTWEIVHMALLPHAHEMPEDITVVSTTALCEAAIASCCPREAGTPVRPGDVFACVFEGAGAGPLPEFAAFQDPDRRDLIKRMCAKTSWSNVITSALLLHNWINEIEHGPSTHTTVEVKEND